MLKRIMALGGIAAVVVAAAWMTTSPAWAWFDEEPPASTVTPEPATMALTALGLGAIGVGARLRKRPSGASKHT